MNYTSEDIKKWYDHEYLKNPKRFHRNWKSYNRFLDLIKPEQGKRILDVACGSGGLLKAAEAKGLIPFGLDISRNGVLLASRIFDDQRLIVANGEQLPHHNNSFDYITNIGSLEHFSDPETALKELTRVLMPGGKVCIVLPNSFGYFGKVVGYKGTGQIIEMLSTLKNWISFLETGQLKIISVHRDLGPSILHDFKPSKILIRLAAKIILPLLPKNCAYQFIFICQKNQLCAE